MEALFVRDKGICRLLGLYWFHGCEGPQPSGTTIEAGRRTDDAEKRALLKCRLTVHVCFVSDHVDKVNYEWISSPSPLGFRRAIFGMIVVGECRHINQIPAFEN